MRYGPQLTALIRSPRFILDVYLLDLSINKIDANKNNELNKALFLDSSIHYCFFLMIFLNIYTNEITNAVTSGAR
jgi:hypothetical protein